MAQQVTIHVNREGPLTESEAEQQILPLQGRGLYQVYGFHAVNGSPALIYIGEVATTTFCQRIPNHFEDFPADAQHSHVYVGCISGPNCPSQVEWIERIDTAGNLIIIAHIPAYNSQN